MKARGLNLTALQEVMTRLVDGRDLGPNQRPHPLKGDYQDCMECHLGGDWLLVWRQTDDEIVFVRTGTHEDLFG
jgi:mRNA interferase YafQ